MEKKREMAAGCQKEGGWEEERGERKGARGIE